MPKKLRTDSKFARLSLEQRQQLATMMLLGKTKLEDVRAWLAERGVEVSLQSISEHYRNHILPEHWNQMAVSANNLDTIGSSAAKDATLHAITQALFEASTRPGADVKELIAGAKLVLDIKAADREERKLAILEQKAAAADKAAEVAGNSELNAEEKAQRIKEIFGLA